MTGCGWDGKVFKPVVRMIRPALGRKTFTTIKLEKTDQTP